jgi:site-specific DNA-cytosine methylase
VAAASAVVADPAVFRWRAVELYAGIGGLAAAWPELEVALAVDINRSAERLYRANFAHPYLVAEIESLPASRLESLSANLWWLSPPCQPYSRRGKQRDLHDPRASSFLHVLGLIDRLRPAALALENVVGFADSMARQQLQQLLQRAGYQSLSRCLCPTEMGWPNRRPRFYLLAIRDELLAAAAGGLRHWRELPRYDRAIETLIDPNLSTAEHEALQLPHDIAGRHLPALDRLELPSPNRPAACFASSYGRTLTRSGSYVSQAGRLRRFAPSEVAALLGFPHSYQLQVGLSRRNLWKLLGNSLSLPAVRYVVSHLPGGPTAQLCWEVRSD